MKVRVVFHSRHGHTTRLAEQWPRGARQAIGAEVLVRRVAETAAQLLVRGKPDSLSP